jgi:hypothetical protein
MSDIPGFADMDDLMPCALGVRCDFIGDCDNEFSGDFWVRESDNKPTRLGVVLDHATKNGWQVIGRNRPETARTFCPKHHRMATS